MRKPDHRQLEWATPPRDSSLILAHSLNAVLIHVVNILFRSWPGLDSRRQAYYRQLEWATPEQFARITTPTLVIHGDADMLYVVVMMTVQ